VGTPGRFLLVAGVAFATPAGADSAFGDMTMLEMPQASLALEPVRAEELEARSGSRGPSSSPRVTATLEGGAVVARLPPLDTSIVPSIVRRVDTVWRLDVPGEQAGAVRVEIEVESPAGSDARFEATDGSGASLPVYVRPSAPRMYATGDGRVTMEGGAELEFPTASMNHAAVYRGRLLVRVVRN
jgi:hypothetical protein